MVLLAYGYSLTLRFEALSTLLLLASEFGESDRPVCKLCGKKPISKFELLVLRLESLNGGEEPLFRLVGLMLVVFFTRDRSNINLGTPESRWFRPQT